MKVYGYQNDDSSINVFSKITRIYNKCIDWSKDDQVITVPTVTGNSFRGLINAEKRQNCRRNMGFKNLAKLVNL